MKKHIKSILARHGIPETLLSHTMTLDCLYPVCNELWRPVALFTLKAECAVQTVKSILNKATDPYLGLLYILYIGVIQLPMVIPQ